MSEDEKLMVSAQREADRKDAAIAELANTEMKANVVRQNAANRAAAPAASNPDQSGAMAAAKETKAVIAAVNVQDGAAAPTPVSFPPHASAIPVASAATSTTEAESKTEEVVAAVIRKPVIEPDGTPITDSQIAEIVALKKDLYPGDQGLKDWLSQLDAKFCVDSAKKLAGNQARGLIGGLKKMVIKRNEKRKVDEAAAVKADENGFVDRVASGHRKPTSVDEWANQAAGIQSVDVPF